MNKAITIDDIKYTLTPVVKEEPLICNLNGVDYSLGPEAPDELNWEEAKEWCKELGADYELPSREVLLIAMLKLTDAGWASGCYWTSSEHCDTDAWIQYWYSSNPGNQYSNVKDLAYRVRAIRRTVI